MLKRFITRCLFVLAVFAMYTSADAAFPTGKKSELAPSTSSSATSGQSSVSAFPNTIAKSEARTFKKSVNGSGSKSKVVAALLAFFLGAFGVHSFYMGQTKKGFIQLGAMLLGLGLFIGGAVGSVNAGTISGIAIVGYLLILGVSIWALVDFVRILTGGLAPEEGFDD